MLFRQSHSLYTNVFLLKSAGVPVSLPHPLVLLKRARELVRNLWFAQVSEAKRGRVLTASLQEYSQQEKVLRMTDR